MLQKLRDRVQGLIAGALFVLLSLCFMLWGVSSYLGSSNPAGKVLAQVGSQKVYQSQLDTVWKQAQQSGQVPMGLGAQIQSIMRKSMLGDLIKQAAQQDMMQRFGLVAGRQQVRQAIAVTPAFMQNGVFSKQQFASVLINNQLTETGLIKMLKRQITGQQLHQGLFSSNFVLPGEASGGYLLLNQKRHIRYALISPQKLAVKIQPNAAQIKTYYQQHQAEFKVPEQLKLSYVVLSPQQVKSEIKISPAQIADYYQQHKASFVAEPQWQLISFKVTAADAKQALTQANQLRVQVLEGRKKFADLAKQYPGNITASWFTAVQLSAAVTAQLRGLSNNELSAPVPAGNSYIVYKLLQHKASKLQSLADVSSKIHQQLLQAQVSQRLQADSDKLSDITYTNPDSLLPASKALGLHIAKTAWLVKGKPGTGILADPKVMTAAFSDDVLQHGNNSKLLTLTDGRLLVLRLAQKKAAYVQPLAEVRAAVVKALQQVAAQTAANKLATQLTGLLQAGKSVNLFLSHNKIAWQQATISAQAHQLPQELVSKAFALVPGKGAVTRVNMSSGEIAVLQLRRIMPAVYSQAKAQQRQQLHATLLKMQTQLAQNIFMHTSRLRAKVRVY